MLVPTTQAQHHHTTPPAEDGVEGNEGGNQNGELSDLHLATLSVRTRGVYTLFPPSKVTEAAKVMKFGRTGRFFRFSAL